MWADIDYMDDYKLFTISQQSYPNLTTKVDKIKADGLTFVPIMDAGVAVRKDQGYKALDDGLDKGVFIYQANKKDFLTAGVWCGNAYFPDFFNPAAVEWWKASF
jgi:alpha-glucosidase